MNKKIKECENVEFLPEKVRNSKKLDTAEKNVLGTLCFYYLNHSIYASKHDGWFFKDQKTIIEESNLSEPQGKRVLLKLIMKRKVERISGTNHKCTHYRLSKEIRELMPENPETDDVDLEGFANEPLDKNRLDESSLEKTRRDESRSIKNKKKFNHKMIDEIKELPVDDFDCSDVNQDTLKEYEMAIHDLCIPSVGDDDEPFI